MRKPRLCHGLRHGLNLALLAAACAATPTWAGLMAAPAHTTAPAAPAAPAAAPGAPAEPRPADAPGSGSAPAPAPTAAAPAAPAPSEPPSASGLLSEVIEATSHEAAAAWLAVREVVHGQVSFYGAYFAGRKTANGERFDPEAMTMAHRHLPFGTLVRVTNLNSGHSVVVRVNDRGPFIAGRVADLSQAAAAHIRMLRQGVAQAKLEVLGKAKGGVGGHTGHSAPHVASQSSAKPTRTPAH